MAISSAMAIPNEMAMADEMAIRNKMANNKAKAPGWSHKEIGSPVPSGYDIRHAKRRAKYA